MGSRHMRQPPGYQNRSQATTCDATYPPDVSVSSVWIEMQNGGRRPLCWFLCHRRTQRTVVVPLLFLVSLWIFVFCVYFTLNQNAAVSRRRNMREALAGDWNLANARKLSSQYSDGIENRMLLSQINQTAFGVDKEARRTNDNTNYTALRINRKQESTVLTRTASTDGVKMMKDVVRTTSNNTSAPRQKTPSRTSLPRPKIPNGIAMRAPIAKQPKKRKRVRMKYVKRYVIKKVNGVNVRQAKVSNIVLKKRVPAEVNMAFQSPINEDPQESVKSNLDIAAGVATTTPTLKVAAGVATTTPKLKVENNVDSAAGVRTTTTEMLPVQNNVDSAAGFTTTTRKAPMPAIRLSPHYIDEILDQPDRDAPHNLKGGSNKPEPDKSKAIKPKRKHAIKRIVVRWKKRNGKKTILSGKTIGKKQPKAESASKPDLLNREHNYLHNLSDSVFDSIFSRNMTMPRNIPILTLFTTFMPSKEKEFVHKNVIRNWAIFSPHVRTILFTSGDFVAENKELAELAQGLDWIIEPVPRANRHGTPFLKEMYAKARQMVDSVFYGYANGDLLFDERIVNSLHSLVKVFKGQPPTGILVVGQRRNYHFGHNTDLYEIDKVHLAAQESILFEPFAEDYFIIARNVFPWNEVPEFVVGRPHYDNYIVAMAKRHHVITVDATNTLMALHLSDVEGDFAGQKERPDRDANIWYAKQKGVTINAKDGFTTACDMETSFKKMDTRTVLELNKKQDKGYHFNRESFQERTKLLHVKEKELHQKHMLAVSQNRDNNQP